MEQFKLNTVTLLLTLGFASQSFAEIQSADANTQVLGKSGIEIVNIATPNAQGLSHNKYQKYNVDRAGAVLNNSTNNGRSQLAGELERNPNLRQQSANIILNEVVSRNASNLAGKQEIFGKRADYVLANPNGITCKGCGFINTQRASLVVGTPNIEQGRLTGYQVDNQNTLTARGNVSNDNLEHLDLVAPKIEIEGNISNAKNINIVMGRNQIQRNVQGDSVVINTMEDGRVLNGRIAGSMNADRIRIHSADSRSIVALENSRIQANEATIQAGNLTAKGKITKSNQLHDSDGIEGKKVKVVRHSNQENQNLSKNQVKVKKLKVAVENNLDLASTDINSAEVTIVAGKVNFGTQITTNRSTNVVNQSKGAWYRNETDSRSEQTVHRTTITADDVKVIASKNKITGKAVKIDAQNVGLYAEQGIQLKGDIESNQYSATSDFKRETAKLKTGNSSQQSNEQNYVATEITAHNQAVFGSAKDILLTGAKLAVDGDLLVKSGGKTQFNSQTTRDQYSLNDQHKFWGGIAGSKKQGKATNQQIQHGSDVTVSGNLRLESDKGAVISGSRVISQGNGYLITKQGNLQIDSAISHQTSETNHRVGTIFNILKAREQAFSHSITSKGSLVKSSSNLYISTDNQLNVRGSEVVADQLLDIAAISGVSVMGVRNSVYTTKQSAGTTLAGEFDPIKVNLDKKAAIKGVLNGLKDKKPVAELANGVKDQVSFSAGGSVTVGGYHHNESTNSVTHNASSVSGGETVVNSERVSITGSQISATSGDLTINANKIITNAQYDREESNSKNTDVGLTLSVKVNQNGITGTINAGVSHKNNHSTTETAQGSELSALGNVNLSANNITHIGSSISAGDSINEKATTIRHLAALNQSNSNETNVDVGVTVQSGIDKSKVINGSIKLSAEGSNQTSHSENATATSLQAGKNINANANTLADQGTKYDANGNVNLTSQVHNLDAARESSHTNKVSGGVSVAVSGNSKDLNTVNLNVSTGVKFQTDRTSEQNEDVATISAQNVRIETGVLNSKANISASENVIVNARQGANFSQANHSKSSQDGGFNVEVGVGALVIPAANTAIPSVNISVGANGHNTISNQGSAGNISANNLAITTSNLNLQGTNVNASSTSLSAGRVNIEGVHHNRRNVDVAAGVSVDVGAGNSSLNVNGSLDVKHENTFEHTATEIHSNNLDINARNLGIVGSSTHSDTLNITASNIHLEAPKNTVNKTDVSVSGSLGGGIANGQWTPNSGSGSVSVEVTRNLTHTSTALNANSATLNSDNVLMIGGSVNADSLSGSVNTVHTHSLVDRVNEVGVALSASGSGKATRYTKEGWKDAVKADWKNGTIAGVKADAKFNVSVKRQQKNVLANLQARNNNLRLNKQSNSGNLAPTIDRNINVSGHINTNGKDMIKRAKEDLKNKRMPWIAVQR